MSYFNKQVNVILNENIEILVMGISELLTILGFEHVLKKFDCDDSKTFHELEDKILELKLKKKYKDADKLSLFLKKKRASCFNQKEFN